MVRKVKDLVGMRFGRLVVMGGRTCDKKGDAAWDCLCDCGNLTHVKMLNLQREGGTRSCGCLARENAAKNGRNSKQHGLSKTPEYAAWRGMLDRCNNRESTAYKNYGGRGITVCDEWASVENFVRDMGTRPSSKHQIDRTDNNLGYSKDNCKWVTVTEQNRNRRCTVRVKLDEEDLTLAEVSEITLINYSTLRSRHYHGKTSEELGLFKGRKDV